MSKSNFGTPLSIIKNLGTHLVLVGENKDNTQSLYSCVKSYAINQKDVCEEIKYSGKAQISRISLARQEKNWFLVTVGNMVDLYKLDEKSGKITKMHAFKADFEGNVNCAVFLHENQYVVTGGDDKIVRAWKLDINKNDDVVTGAKEIRKFTSHITPVTNLDVTFNHELIASIGSSDEKHCLIHDFQTGSLLNELTFQEDLAFVGCIFSLHAKYLYTLVSEKGKSSYVTRWDAKRREFPSLNTVKIDNSYCPHFAMSSEGFYLVIGSQDGYIKSLNTRYMEIDRDERGGSFDPFGGIRRAIYGPDEDPNAPRVTCLEFTSDTRFILTCDTDGNYSFVPNIRAPGFMRFFFQGLMVTMFAYYIYRLIMEAYYE